MPISDNIIPAECDPFLTDTERVIKVANNYIAALIELTRYPVAPADMVRRANDLGAAWDRVSQEVSK